jgi:hypothetical protein
MLKIKYHPQVIHIVEQYIRQYRIYYQELYSDTGIWWENQIIDNYIRESVDREEELYTYIEKIVSPDIILGRTPLDTIFLPWRSKTLWISWEDDGDTRIVRDLIIR